MKRISVVAGIIAGFGLLLGVAVYLWIRFVVPMIEGFFNNGILY